MGMSVLRAAAAALVLMAGSAQAGEKYEVVVSFDAAFGKDGALTELTPHEEAAHPAAFWAALKPRLAKMRITAPLDAQGQPATLGTGLHVHLTVDKTGGDGQVQIAGLNMGPLVLKREYAGYPEDIGRVGGWEGSVSAECMIGTDGRCGDVQVKAVPGMPQSVLRWASATLGLWEFKVPRMNGVPFAVPFGTAFQLNTSDSMPENFLYKGLGKL